MTQTQTQFEDRLLTELQHVVADRPAPSVPAPSRRRRRPARLLLGAAAGLAAAVLAAVVIPWGGGVTPAFAVDRQANGSVTVTINRLSDAAGLERELRAAGVPAVVNYTPFGKTCREPRGTPAGPPSGGRVSASVSGSSSSNQEHSSTFTITRNMVPPGATLVIMTSGGTNAASVGMEVVRGAVSACQLVDAPTPPAGPGKGFTTSGATPGSGSGPTSRSLHTGP